MLRNLSKVGQLTSGSARIQTRVTGSELVPLTMPLDIAISRLRLIQKMACFTQEIRVMNERVTWQGMEVGGT